MNVEVLVPALASTAFLTVVPPNVEADAPALVNVASLSATSAPPANESTRFVVLDAIAIWPVPGAT